MTAEQFARKYGLKREQEELAPGLLPPAPYIHGMNGGINIYNSGWVFEVVVITLSWLEKWSVKRGLAGAGMRIKRASGPEFHAVGRVSDVVATFDPDDGRQAVLAVESASIPSSHPPEPFGKYLK